MAQPSTVAGFPLACHAEAYASPARTEVMSILQTQPDAKEWSERDERHGRYSRDCGTKAGHFRTARCCNGTSVARSTADVGEAVLSTSSAAAAFSSVHRDNG